MKAINPLKGFVMGRLKGKKNEKPAAPTQSPAQRRSFPWRWGLAVLGLLLLGLGGGGAWYYHSLRLQKAPVPPDPWTTRADLETVASYLNRHVLLPHFHALVYSVAMKDNLWTIAKKHDVDIDTVVGLNPYLKNLAVRYKQLLLLANTRGAIYQVKPDQDLPSLLASIKEKAAAVTAANRIPWPGPEANEVLFLPDRKPVLLSPPMEALYHKRELFRSPLTGRYTSFLGWRIDPITGGREHHNGVDIAAPMNSLISAAASGKVVFAGVNDGFGNCVIIDHAYGYRTLYGHMKVILVHYGEKVRQGQIIGRVGMTGRTTGPHLHFTIWKNGKLENPLEYLW